jgi:hypothetical protein
VAAWQAGAKAFAGWAGCCVGATPLTGAVVGTTCTGARAAARLASQGRQNPHTLKRTGSQKQLLPAKDRLYFSLHLTPSKFGVPTDCYRNVISIDRLWEDSHIGDR